jgi:hypothetical protein
MLIAGKDPIRFIELAVQTNGRNMIPNKNIKILFMYYFLGGTVRSSNALMNAL